MCAPVEYAPEVLRALAAPAVNAAGLLVRSTAGRAPAAAGSLGEACPAAVQPCSLTPSALAGACTIIRQALASHAWHQHRGCHEGIQLDMMLHSARMLQDATKQHALQ